MSNDEHRSKHSPFSATHLQHYQNHSNFRSGFQPPSMNVPPPVEKFVDPSDRFANSIEQPLFHPYKPPPSIAATMDTIQHSKTNSASKRSFAVAHNNFDDDNTFNFPHSSKFPQTPPSKRFDDDMLFSPSSNPFNSTSNQPPHFSAANCHVPPPNLKSQQLPFGTDNKATPVVGYQNPFATKSNTPSFVNVPPPTFNQKHFNTPPPFVSASAAPGNSSSVPSGGGGVTVPPPSSLLPALHSIPPPKPMSLNKIPPPRELDLNAIPEPTLDLDAIKVPEHSISRGLCHYVFFFCN